MKKVIRYTAAWCGPCRVYAPIFDKVASNNPGIIFETVDVDNNPLQAQNHNIRSVPTTVVVQNGNVVRSVSGVLQERELQALVAS